VQLRALRICHYFCDGSLFEIDARLAAGRDGPRQKVGLTGVVPHDHDGLVVAVFLDHVDELIERTFRSQRLFFMQLAFESDLIPHG